MDNFYEQFVSTEESMLYKTTKFLVYFIGAIAAIYLFTGGFLFFLISAAGAVICYFLRKQLYVEFEYIYTNGVIDIDKIIDKNKRKRAVSFDLSDIEIIAPLDSDDIKYSSFKPQNTYNFYPEKNEDKKYSILLNHGGQRLQVNFVPNDEFLKLCVTKNPRKVKL